LGIEKLNYFNFKDPKQATLDFCLFIFSKKKDIDLNPCPIIKVL